jgi:hypothetical protein
MASLVATVANSMRCFGGARASYWGLDWGEFKWGEGTFLITVSIGHRVSEAQGMATAFAFGQERLVSETQALSAAPADLALLDSDGYEVVFPDGSTSNGVDRYFPAWSSFAVDTETWASGAVSLTSWSSQ